MLGPAIAGHGLENGEEGDKEIVEVRETVVDQRFVVGLVVNEWDVVLGWWSAVDSLSAEVFFKGIAEQVYACLGPVGGVDGHLTFSAPVVRAVRKELDAEDCVEKEEEEKEKAHAEEAGDGFDQRS